MEWLGGSCHHSMLQDCFNLGPENWYGEGTQRPQRWTLGPRAHGEEAFTIPDAFRGVRERLWISSSGIALLVPWTVPLWVSFNKTADGLLCLGTKNNPKIYPFRNWNDTKYLRLRYQVYVGPDILTTARYLLHYVLPKQQHIPMASLLKIPSWTLTSRNHSGTAEIDRGEMEGFLNEISSNGFTGQVIFLPHGYINKTTLNSGLLLDVFPEISGSDACIIIPIKPTLLIDNMGDLSLRVTEPSAFQPQIRPNSGRVFKRGMNLLDRLGICSTSISMDVTYDRTKPDIYLNILSKHKLPLLHVLARSSLSTFPMMPIFIETAADMQGMSAMIKMRPISRWRDLQALIPETLLIGLMGYPFIISPGVLVQERSVGYSYDNHATGLEELYIRWIQTVALFPSIHFGAPPWSVGGNATRIVQDFLQLRQKYMRNIDECAEEALLSGAPILRPLWWLSPHDPHAQSCQDQFVLGDDVIVAPVLHRGWRSRDVYLPYGYWYDNLRSESVIGPRWLLDYPVGLRELAVFTREMLPEGPPEMDSLVDVHMW